MNSGDPTNQIAGGKPIILGSVQGKGKMSGTGGGNDNIFTRVKPKMFQVMFPKKRALMNDSLFLTSIRQVFIKKTLYVTCRIQV
jgi:hypothetical protein